MSVFAMGFGVVGCSITAPEVETPTPTPTMDPITARETAVQGAIDECALSTPSGGVFSNYEGIVVRNKGWDSNIADPPPANSDDNGSTILPSESVAPGSEASPGTYDSQGAARCLLEGLGAPEAALKKFDATKVLTGQQVVKWSGPLGDWRASWRKVHSDEKTDMWITAVDDANKKNPNIIDWNRDRPNPLESPDYLDPTSSESDPIHNW